MVRRRLLFASGIAGVFCLGGGLTLAQQALAPEEEGGTTFTFGISSTLSYSDNYNLRPNNAQSAALFDHRLSFGLETKRQLDTLRLDLDGVLRVLDAPGRDSRRLDDPRVSLSYDRQGFNTAISTSAEYRLTSVNFLDPLERDRDFDDDPLDETDLTLDEGERELITTQFSFETGLSDPLGFTFDARYRDRSFSGTTDPDLFDSEILNLSGGVRLTVTPKTEARVILDFEDYTADDAPKTDRTTTALSLAVTQIVTKVDRLDARIGYQSIETEETILGIRRTDTTNGLVGGFGLTRELRRGTIGTNFDVSESENGRTATWTINRAMALPRGSLVLSFGVTSDVSDTLVPVGSIAFTQEMKRGSLTASLDRQVQTSSQANELETTRAAVGYTHTINAKSGIELAADFASFKESGGPAVNDSSRARFRASYNHDLTQHWQLVTGYEFRMEDEEGMDTATSNTLFLTLGRVFVIRR